MSLRSSLVWVLMGMGLLLGSCSSDKGGRDNRYDQVQHQIDKGDYTAAIETTEEMLQGNEQDHQARVLMASAYAARAGVFMRNYLDLARDFFETTEEAERMFDERGFVVFKRLEARNGTDGDALKILQALYKAVWRVSDVLHKIDLVPTLAQGPQQDDLQRAIEILAEDTELKGGPAFYRGLLRLTLLKSRIKTDYYVMDIQVCKIDSFTLAEQLGLVGDEFLPVFEDLIVGSMSESRRKTFARARDETIKALDDVLQLIVVHAITMDSLDMEPIVEDLGGKCAK